MPQTEEREMMKMIKKAQLVVRDESGVTAIEYGLLAALIAVAIIAGATLLGTNLDALFTRIAGLLD
jgi:pilus assembly protein Flp/PilA